MLLALPFQGARQNGASLGAYPQLVAQAHHWFELHLKRRGKHSRSPCHHLRQTPERVGKPCPARDFSAAVYVAKRELFKIPFFGWGLKLVKTIGIDRSNSREANKQLLEQGVARKTKVIGLPFSPKAHACRPEKKAACKLAARAWQNVRDGHRPRRAQQAASLAAQLLPQIPGTVSVIIGKPIAHNNGNEAELMAQCEQWIESQQPLITGQGPFAPKPNKSFHRGGPLCPPFPCRPIFFLNIMPRLHTHPFQTAHHSYPAQNAVPRKTSSCAPFPPDTVSINILRLLPSAPLPNG